MVKKLQNRLDELPTNPGVYFFKDSSGKIIYIGKASILKRRVRSYFTGAQTDAKTLRLVKCIADVDWVQTSSEIDALFLEAEYIKRHKPLYNVRERDDKNFIFVRITTQQDFPSVTLVRRPNDDKARYFGPFVQSYGVRQALKYLRRVFPYFVKENHNYSSKLEYQIGVLPSPDVTKLVYRRQISKLIMVLEGKSTQLIDSLQRDISRLAKDRKYEEAIVLRNQYLALKSLGSRVVFGAEEKIIIGKDEALSGLTAILQLSSSPRRIECYDISNFAGGDSVSSMVVFTDGLPDNAAYRHFKMRTRGPNDFAMMQETISRRFGTRNKSWPKPDLIIVDGGKGQLSCARQVISELGIKTLTVGLAKRFETLVIDREDLPNPTQLAKEGGYYIANFEPDSAVLHLLQRVRDEAHRFAVAYHTKVRAKRIAHSQLEEIPGVGPATRKKLIMALGSVAGVKEASPEKLEAIVGAKLAKLIASNLPA